MENYELIFKYSRGPNAHVFLKKVKSHYLLDLENKL